MIKKPDGRIAKGADTRQNILTVALETLAESGIEGLTAGKLAAKAKVSKSNVFHHFPKVDEIPLILIQEMLDQFSSNLRTKNHDSITGFLKSIGKSVVNAHPEMRKRSAVVINFYLRSAHDERFRSVQEKMTKLVIAHFKTTFEEILDRGLSRKEQRAVPMLVAMALEGMTMLSIVVEDKAALKGGWELLGQMIEGYLERGKSD